MSLKVPVPFPSNDHSWTELSGKGWSSSSCSELLLSPSLQGRGNMRCPEDVAKNGSVGWILHGVKWQREVIYHRKLQTSENTALIIQWNRLGHSSFCFSSTTLTSFYFSQASTFQNQYINVCVAFAVNSVIKAFGKHSRNLAVFLYKQLHFTECLKLCFLILHLPLHWFSAISRMRNRIFPCYGLTQVMNLTSVCFPKVRSFCMWNATCKVMYISQRVMCTCIFCCRCVPK